MADAPKRGRIFGPGLLVAAAFIGPGTVTAASQAGAQFGYSLIWAVTFSVIATVVLQEMAARLGIVTGIGLGEAIRFRFRGPKMRFVAAALIIVAIGFGNAAYQTGNLTGAAVGMEVLLGGSITFWSLLMGAAAFGLLWGGGYKLLERVLIAMVMAMSLVFIAAAIMARPDVVSLAKGTLLPTLPTDSLTTVIALFGTTIVPYNLFLHASSVREHWTRDVPRDQALRGARIDTLLSVAIGGMITAAIITTAAAAFAGTSGTFDAATMAKQLEPALGGKGAKILFAMGLLSAGMSSAITAPLAAAYAVSGVMKIKPDLKSWRFRSIWISVLVAGTLVAAFLGKSPTETILIAQVANGLLLPLIAIFLLLVVNQKKLMGPYANGRVSNVLGFVVVGIVSLLGVWKLAQPWLPAPPAKTAPTTETPAATETPETPVTPATEATGVEDEANPTPAIEPGEVEEGVSPSPIGEESSSND